MTFLKWLFTRRKDEGPEAIRIEAPDVPLVGRPDPRLDQSERIRELEAMVEGYKARERERAKHTVETLELGSTVIIGDGTRATIEAIIVGMLRDVRYTVRWWDGAFRRRITLGSNEVTQVDEALPVRQGRLVDAD